MKNPKCFSCSNANFFWSDQTFCKISLLEFVSKRLWIEMTGFHTPIYFINESIVLKNESFCVVCIITYITVVLLFKDGSNTLHVILTCILLFTLFRWCCNSIIVLTRWIGWLKQQQWPKIRLTFSCYFVTQHLWFRLKWFVYCSFAITVAKINICIDLENKLFSFHWSLSKLYTCRMKPLKFVVHFQWWNLEHPDCSLNRRYSTTCVYMYSRWLVYMYCWCYAS